MNDPLPKLVDYLKMDFDELDRQLYTLANAPNDSFEEVKDLKKRELLIKTLVRQIQSEDMVEKCKAGIATLIGTYVPPQKPVERKRKS